MIPHSQRWKRAIALSSPKATQPPALYAVMAQRGYFPEEELKSLRKVGSRLQGHPSMKLLPGIDMSTGSLGQGISAAVGMALGSKYGHKGFRVYTVLGDGELEEGQVWEAAMFAAAKKLDNLVAIVDNNNLQIDGSVEEGQFPLSDSGKICGLWLECD